MKLGPLSSFGTELLGYFSAWAELERTLSAREIIKWGSLERLRDLDPTVNITPPENSDKVPDWPIILFEKGLDQVSKKLREEVIEFMRGRASDDYPPEFEEFLSAEYIGLNELKKINDHLSLLNVYPDLLRLKEKFETNSTEISSFPCYIPAFSTRAYLQDTSSVNDLPNSGASPPAKPLLRKRL